MMISPVRASTTSSYISYTFSEALLESSHKVSTYTNYLCLLYKLIVYTRIMSIMFPVLCEDNDMNKFLTALHIKRELSKSSEVVSFRWITIGLVVLKESHMPNFTKHINSKE